MKMIAIDTADAHGSVAALHAATGNSTEVDAVDLPHGKRSAQVLAPTLDQLLQNVGWSIDEIDAVAVTTGPGSFTGIRIGVTTAKTLAYAAGAGCVPINTLAVLAAQAREQQPSWPRGWAVLDAQRRQLFAAAFSTNTPADQPVDASIVEVDDWLAQLKPGDGVVGPVLQRLRDRLPHAVELSPEPTWRPKAATVANLALADCEAGRMVSPFELAPSYYRLSAAEEKLQQKST